MPPTAIEESLPSVHTQDFTVELTEARTSYDPLSLVDPPAIHASWMPVRELTFRAMSGGTVSRKRLQRFCSCARHTLVFKSVEDPGRFKLVRAMCHDRFCQPCQRIRTATVRVRLAAAMADQTCRLLTLTLAADGKPLRDRCNRLYDSFRKLRQRSFWKKNVGAGCAVLEIARNPTTGSWHPHLHCILTGKFLPQATLVSEWRAVTGDSYVVDVRLIREHEKALNYVAKYITKTVPDAMLRDELVCAELIRALHRRRALVTFGSWARKNFTKPEKCKNYEYLTGSLDIDVCPGLDENERRILAVAMRWYTQGRCRSDVVIPAEPEQLAICLAAYGLRNAHAPPLHR